MADTCNQMPVGVHPDYVAPCKYFTWFPAVAGTFLQRRTFRVLPPPSSVLDKTAVEKPENPNRSDEDATFSSLAVFGQGRDLQPASTTTSAGAVPKNRFALDGRPRRWPVGSMSRNQSGIHIDAAGYLPFVRRKAT